MPTPNTLTAHGLGSTLTVDAPSQRESSADAKGLDQDPDKGFDIPSFTSSGRLGWLLQQYSNLMCALLREVSAPNYEIAEESRSRIRADIVLTQNREMTTLSQVYRPGVPSLENSSMGGITRLRLHSLNEDYDIEDRAEHIVDGLLAKWTTLPLHAN